ncbi:hypothetical protein J3D45_002927 [Microbacterium foliorum]|uniref:hypothetical protein n=1 Tax=Microbacterium foliorum TaxID=104336 RepID=UPI0020A14B8F|nr:hypothetical protein [Microbacterium foliorum]MCP1430429.1 hypothetical protein [Microbacterium foliorum]
MTSGNRRFIFRPLAVIGAVVSAGLTILLGILQVGSWINENAVWVLWGTIATLIGLVLLITARLAAATEVAVSAEKKVAEARRDAEHARADASVATKKLREVETAALSVRGLSSVDQALAAKLFEYSSDEQTLRTVGYFSPYQISQAAVQKIEELSELPITRTAHNPELAKQIETLTDAAQRWLSILLPLISARGDYLTTRPDHHLPEGAYHQHIAKTDDLRDTGFDLHRKFLAYQQYYASL